MRLTVQAEGLLVQIHHLELSQFPLAFPVSPWKGGISERGLQQQCPHDAASLLHSAKTEAPSTAMHAKLLASTDERISNARAIRKSTMGDIDVVLMLCVVVFKSKVGCEKM